MAELVRAGARGDSILGNRGKNVRLAGTDSARRMVDKDGIMAADVVLVPLEDGDRAGGAGCMQKKR